MVKARIVCLPVGSGKTRTVWKNILRGLGPSIAAWNARVSRTLVVGPNRHIELVWARGLLILAIRRRLLSGISEGEVRASTKKKWISKAFAKAKLTRPRFCTYGSLAEQVPKSCHYLVLDKWHGTPERIRTQCANWIEKRGKKLPWYVGGSNIKKCAYFVSATPVNPVLEREDAQVEDALDDSKVRERVSVAVRRALITLQGVVGRRLQGDYWRFFDGVRRLQIDLLESAGATWAAPTPIELGGEHPEAAELAIIRAGIALDGGNAWAMEYAHAVGLVRTTSYDRKTRTHRLSHAYTGVRKSFGKRYQVLYVVGKPPSQQDAATYLAQRHPRFHRLMTALKLRGIVNDDEKTLTGEKALIFCSHRGVAIGLTETLNRKVGHNARGSMSVARTNVDAVDLEDLVARFNTPGKAPYLLVATDALSEGIDLHGDCHLLVHYELP